MKKFALTLGLALALSAPAFANDKQVAGTETEGSDAAAVQTETTTKQIKRTKRMAQHKRGAARKAPAAAHEAAPEAGEGAAAPEHR